MHLLLTWLINIHELYNSFRWLQKVSAGADNCLSTVCEIYSGLTWGERDFGKRLLLPTVACMLPPLLMLLCVLIESSAGIVEVLLCRYKHGLTGCVGGMTVG